MPKKKTTKRSKVSAAIKPTKPSSKGLSAKAPRRIKVRPKLPSVVELVKSSSLVIWQYKQLFLGLTIVYGLLNLILVQGLANTTDVHSLKNQLSQASHGNFGSLASGLSIFAVLVTSAGNGSSQTAGSYQLFLALITSLAIIWALRQVMAGHQFRIRDAYYRGMYPLIPFVLVLMIIGLQLLPLLIGSTLYSTVMNNGIAVGLIEKGLALLAFIGLALASLYMLSSSIFGLYIVSLPDMTPIKALKSAKQLVSKRRWTVLRKLLALPVVLLIGAAIIMLPLILWLTFLAQWVFFLLTMFALVAVHAYMYNLYRELLNE